MIAAANYEMQNPWIQLPDKPPYVAPEDEQAVGEFDSASKDPCRIRLEIFPEPYLGRPDAPVVLLALNPGFKEKDIGQHADPKFAARSRCNLLHAPMAYPFYLLDPEINRTQWWDIKLHRLMQKFGDAGRSIVANSVLCVEFFPYHSHRYMHRNDCLLSQQYSFYLVREAIRRQSVILLMRGEKHWLDQIPELASYAKRHSANSVQNPVVTKPNFGEGFDAAVEAITSASHAAARRTVT